MGIKEEVTRAKSTLFRIKSSPARRERQNKIDRERRTPHGHFHIAESYFISARKLRTFKQSGHSDHAVRLLYYTALEIYLKAFLRLYGLSTAELARKELGHRYCCLLERAGKFGFPFNAEDSAVLYFLSYSDERERVRYLETGAVNWTDLDALNRTCSSMRELVFEPLKAAGLPVRLLAATTY